MRIFLFLALIIASTYAKPTNSFQAIFTQTVESDQGDAISYEGEVYFQENRALWHYINPSEKMIYIQPNTVVVIEPPLEQVIISEHNEMQRMQSLLDDWLEFGQKEIEFDGIAYKVTFENGLPKQIDYLDSLENKVIISLDNVQINTPLESEKLTPHIPEGFDVLEY